MSAASTPDNTVWVDEWICPDEGPQFVVECRAPLHNPLRCQTHRRAMTPALTCPEVSA